MPDRLPNGRDLGELRTAAGLPLRRGAVYRSAALMRPEHAAAVAQLGIERVYDLRTTGTSATTRPGAGRRRGRCGGPAR